MALLAIAAGVGVAYAAGLNGDWLRVTGTEDFIMNTTQVMNHTIHMTDSQDFLRFAGGNDAIYMGNHNDEINLGPHSDSITFYGSSSDTESIHFNEAQTSYMKWTGATDTIEIRSNSGDVVITLGQ